MVDPTEEVTSLMCKWIITTMEPQSSNFKRLLRYRLSMFQPYAGGNWSPNLLWVTFPHHAAKMGSKIWERTVQSWKLLVGKLSLLPPDSFEEWLSSSFW
jgi:hypothetical protein